MRGFFFNTYPLDSDLCLTPRMLFESATFSLLFVLQLRHPNLRTQMCFRPKITAITSALEIHHWWPCGPTGIPNSRFEESIWTCIEWDVTACLIPQILSLGYLVIDVSAAWNISKQLPFQGSCYLYRTIGLWNNLDPFLKSSGSVQVFKRILKNKLLDNFVNTSWTHLFLVRFLLIANFRQCYECFLNLHRAKSRVSVFLKRGGNVQLYVSAKFMSCGNVKIQVYMIPSRFRNGNAKSRFRHI